jgi:hypothetical protein
VIDVVPLDAVGDGISPYRGKDLRSSALHCMVERTRTDTQ